MFQLHEYSTQLHFSKMLLSFKHSEKNFTLPPLNTEKNVRITLIQRVYNFCEKSSSEYNVILNKYFKKMKECDNLGLFYAKMFIVRKVFCLAISNFHLMSKYWRNLFESHYIEAINIKNNKHTKRTFLVAQRFIKMSEKYMLNHLCVAFQLPLKYFKIFVCKYPKETFEYGMKKSINHWLSKDMANIVNKQYNSLIIDVKLILNRFPVEIINLITSYLFHLPIKGKDIVEYFTSVYDFECDIFKTHSKYYKHVRKRINDKEYFHIEMDDF